MAYDYCGKNLECLLSSSKKSIFILNEETKHLLLLIAKQTVMKQSWDGRMSPANYDPHWPNTEQIRTILLFWKARLMLYMCFWYNGARLNNIKKTDGVEAKYTNFIMPWIVFMLVHVHVHCMYTCVLPSLLISDMLV